jgi:hypothetical protein
MSHCSQAAHVEVARDCGWQSAHRLSSLVRQSIVPRQVQLDRWLVNCHAYVRVCVLVQPPRAMQAGQSIIVNRDSRHMHFAPSKRMPAEARASVSKSPEIHHPDRQQMAFVHVQCVCVCVCEHVFAGGNQTPRQTQGSKKHKTHSHTKNSAICQHMRTVGNNTGRQIPGRKTHRAHFSLDNI